jgi:hypothetical protein
LHLFSEPRDGRQMFGKHRAVPRVIGTKWDKNLEISGIE